MQEMGNRVSLEQNAARYLFKYKNNTDEISPDSVKKYLPLLFQWSKFSFINDAMEMLKTSSLIQKIKNKELALQIIKTYGSIKSGESAFEMYMHYKTQVQNEFNDNPQVKDFTYNQNKEKELLDHNENDELFKQLYLLYSLPEGINLLRTIANILSPQIFYDNVEEIDKTIAAIEKEYS